nr:T4SS guanine nucleotide exchange effector RalF [Rickettsia endosymbiont of Ceutorhynchus assimilis]
MPFSEKNKKEIINFFNNHSKDGIKKIKDLCLQQNKDFVEEIAKFFCEEKRNLNLESVGDYLGTRGEDNQKILKSFVKQFDFKEKFFLESLRDYLKTFKLPGEAQKIDRLVEAFGKKYCEQNPDGEIKSKDAAYILAFQTIMLNTDLHSSSIAASRKMTFEELKKNLRGTNDNRDFNEEFLKKLYNKIKAEPFELNFTENAVGYEINNVNYQNDTVFKNLNNFLKSNDNDIKNIFPKLKDIDGLKTELNQPKFWLNKFTGYEGEIKIQDIKGAEVQIQIYEPNIFSQWLLGGKSKVIIQPLCEEGKQPTPEAVNLAAQIAASFDTDVIGIKATYDYLKEDLEKAYKILRFPDQVKTPIVSTTTQLHNLLKETTRKVQKEEPELQKVKDKQLSPEAKFNDLETADLGDKSSDNKISKVTEKKALTIAEELATKFAVSKKQDATVRTSSSQVKSSEEKINNHEKRLEELKQKQIVAQKSKKVAEAELKKLRASKEKAPSKAIINNINERMREINNKIIPEAEATLKSCEKEINTIKDTAKRAEQFNNKNSSNKATKSEPTAVERQAQGAMAAIKRKKEEIEKQKQQISGIVSNEPRQPSKSLLSPSATPMPPPPPLPPVGWKSQQQSVVNKSEIPINIQQQVTKAGEVIKQEPTKSGEQNDHKQELANAIKKHQLKKVDHRSSSRRR